MRRSLCALLACLLMSVFAQPAQAHEVRPAYLELTQQSADTFDVLWKVPAKGDLRLALYVRLPASVRNVTEPIGVFRDNTYIERWTISGAGALVGAEITIDGLRETMTDVLVRIQRLDGATQVERLAPDRPHITVLAAPSAIGVSWTYFIIGVEHIIFGIDHLLFVLALLLLVRGWRRVVATVTAFTLAHSVTLALATLGVVHVPGPPVEAAIALSIAFVAAEIVHTQQGRPALAERWPWTVAFLFGLLHGLGFAGALSEVGLPEQAIPLALLFFNLGVEAGQLLFIAALFAVAGIALRLAPRLSRLSDRGASALAYALGAVATLWLFERIAAF